MRIAVVFLSVLVLTGCVGSDPPVTPAPTPTSTPLFASDAEALKAAEAAYKRFNDVADAVFDAGGVGADRLNAVSVDPLLKESLRDFEDVRAKGLRSTGKVVDRDFRLQSTGPGPADAVVMYVCEDLSGSDVVDANGHSVVKPSRPDSQLFAIHFTALKSGTILPSSQEPWSDNC